MQLSQHYELSLEDFACAFGTEKENLSQDVRDLISKINFRYEKLSQEERDRIILDILKKLETNQFSRVGQERKEIWSNAWSEYLQAFIESNHSLEALNPKFMKPNQVVRLNSEFVKPQNPNFELDFFAVFRIWLFKQYLAEINAVYEFGCGSVFNLVALAKLYPEKKLYGLDWAIPSVQLVDKIAETQGFNMKGYRFDFFAPDSSLEIENNSAFLTMCALEQIGGNYQDFISFVLEKSPKLCINMEPICELYNEENLIDYLAIKYHKQRGYLDEYLSYLRKLESENKLIIRQVKRLNFGSLYHEGYSLIIWEPTGN